MVLHTQLRCQATLTQPFQCDLQTLSCNTKELRARTWAKRLMNYHVSIAICRDWVAKHTRTMHKNIAKTTPEQWVPLRSWETELLITKELRAKTLTKRCPELAVPLRGRFEHDPGTNERVPHPSPDKLPHTSSETPLVPPKHSISCICYLSKAHFVRDFLQIPSVQALQTQILCEDFLQILKVQDVKVTPEPAVPQRDRSYHHPGRTERVPHPSAGQASETRFVPKKHSISCIHYLSKHTSCKTSFKFQVFKLQENQTFRHPDFQTFDLSGIQTFRQPGFQTFKHANIKTFRHLDMQTFKLSDIQTFKHSNFEGL